MRLASVINPQASWMGGARHRQTPAAAERGAAGRSSAGADRGLELIEHRLRMAGHLDPAPAVGNPAARVDQEGAAFDAEHLAAVHVLFLDHRKRLAQRLVLVAAQRKTKADRKSNRMNSSHQCATRMPS